MISSCPLLLMLVAAPVVGFWMNEIATIQSDTTIAEMTDVCLFFENSGVYSTIDHDS